MEYLENDEGPMSQYANVPMFAEQKQVFFIIFLICKDKRVIVEVLKEVLSLCSHDTNSI